MNGPIHLQITTNSGLVVCLVCINNHVSLSDIRQMVYDELMESVVSTEYCHGFNFGIGMIGFPLKILTTADEQRILAQHVMPSVAVVSTRSAQQIVNAIMSAPDVSTALSQSKHARRGTSRKRRENTFKAGNSHFDANVDWLRNAVDKNGNYPSVRMLMNKRHIGHKKASMIIEHFAITEMNMTATDFKTKMKIKNTKKSNTNKMQQTDTDSSRTMSKATRSSDNTKELLSQCDTKQQQ
eukprot:207147_1